MTLVTMIIVNVLIVLALGALAKFVKLGQADTTQGGWNFNYSTSDLIIMAVIVAIAAVINTGLAYVWGILNVSGPVAGAVLQGTFVWGYLLAYFLVRKPGAMLIVGIMETLVEGFIGNQVGLAAIGWGLTQGLAAEIVMAFVNYGDFGWWAFALAGAAASQFGTIWTAYWYGWDSTPATVAAYWMPATPIELVSGFIFSGLLGWWLGKMVERTGLVRATRKQ